MSGAQTPTDMSPKLLKVMERARAHPEETFNSLAHLIDEVALARVFRRIRRDAAVGVDGVTKDHYEQDLEKNLRDLHDRLRSKRYRHQPIRRVQIPKGDGRTRPIGVSAFEDKLVQGAVSDLLGAIYEQDFLDCSFGFRLGCSAHDAVLAVNQAVRRGKANWILEADIASFFDSIDRKMLMEMIRKRVVDGSVLRLIGKCLHAGVLEGTERSNPVTGTAQGSALSPLLGNV
jgi:RNA-directed DNA polymerase